MSANCRRCTHAAHEPGACQKMYNYTPCDCEGDAAMRGVEAERDAYKRRAETAEQELARLRLLRTRGS